MFGERLSQLRLAQGLSQSELARRSGLAPSAVNNLEHGRRWPRATTLRKLAAGLNVPPTELLQGVTPNAV